MERRVIWYILWNWVSYYRYNTFYFFARVSYIQLQYKGCMGKLYMK